jgi:hypothetical protein
MPARAATAGRVAPGGDLLLDFIGAQSSNLKNLDFSGGDFKKLKRIVGP